MLSFKKIESSDLEVIKKYMQQQVFGTCDYTVFGIYLWSDYYSYAYCVYKDTFFLKRLSDDTVHDFAVPVGRLPVVTAIEYIKEYCKKNEITPRFYFVPETALEYFQGADIKQLDGWSDYIYNAEDLKTLRGHRFNKKRNRLNKFIKNCENCFGSNCCRFEPITTENIEEAKHFFDVYLTDYTKQEEHFTAESVLIRRVLDDFFNIGQSGGLLFIKDKPVAMTIGEVIGDTLYVHVEKALREYEGAYEAINYAYANQNATGDVQFINREEDMGDEGLRQAKMAYNPVKLIHKYEIMIP
ncbi:MAG TPA: hypothetical protein DD733_07340 [Clostridiales bacterium]|nr:hypothetical protein [Clostridiales bacterium]